MEKLTARQETFCLKYIELNNGTQAALAAGYSKKTAKVIASENLTKPAIKARLAELREKTGQTEDNTIATVLERKQVLTQIVRGRFADFMTNLTVDKLRSPALQEVRVVEFKGGKEGRATEKTTTIKLHSPITAIAELNKMEQIYTEGTTVNVDNRQLNVIVEDNKTKELLGEVVQGVKPHE
jgi:phage terminase small subunit